MSEKEDANPEETQEATEREPGEERNVGEDPGTGEPPDGEGEDLFEEEETLETQVANLTRKMHTAYSLAVGAVVIAMIAVGAALINISVNSEDTDLTAQVGLNTNSITELQQVTGITAPEPAQIAPAVPLLSLDGKTGGLLDETGAIVVGERAGDGSEIEVLVDYQCPFCNIFENAVGYLLMDQAAEGSGNAVIFSTLSFLAGEGESPGQVDGASGRAANAAMCVARYDEDRFLTTNKALFESVENGPGLSAEAIAKVLEDVGVSKKAKSCSADGEFYDVISELTGMSFNRGVQAVPTVIVDGTQVQGDASISPEVTSLLK